MKKVFPLFILTLTFFCCTQTSNVVNKELQNLADSTNTRHFHESDTTSLTIFKTHYVVSLKGQQREINTQQQLSEILKNVYNRQDTLYIFIDDATGDQVENVMESIHNSNVDRFRVIVKNEFFKLPYPDQK